MNPLKSLQERVVLLSGLPKNIAAVDRAATHLMGFGKVEGLVSWVSKGSRRQYALVTFATVDGSRRALQVSSIKTMYGELGVLEPQPSMWKFLNPSSSGSTRHMPLSATPVIEAKGGPDPNSTASILVAMEKRMKEIEKSLAKSRQSWTASIKSIEEDVRELKGRYDKRSDTTAKSASNNTTCRGSRISLETNDHLLRLVSIMMEELKRRPTS